MNIGKGSDLSTSWDRSHLAVLPPAAAGFLVAAMAAWYHDRTLAVPSDADADAGLLWEYADRHGLGGVLGALAVGGNLGGTDLAAAATARYLSTALHAERARLVALRLQRVAAEARIGFAFVKGVVLAHEVYDDPGVRPFSDIDLIVRSRAEGQALFAEVDPAGAVDAAAGSFFVRIRDAGKIQGGVDGWEVEASYPLRNPVDPAGEFVASRAAGLVPLDDAARLAHLCPEDHLVFLIAHAAWHLCSRHIWLLDIAVLLRHHAGRIDIERVVASLERLRCRAVGAAMLAFCREWIDGDLPALPTQRPGWNQPFISAMLTPGPGTLRGTLAAYHRRADRRAFAYLISATRLYLLTDTPARDAWPAAPWRWTAARIAAGMRNESALVRWLLAGGVAVVLAPLGRLLALLYVRWSGVACCAAARGGGTSAAGAGILAPPGEPRRGMTPGNHPCGEGSES